jgi:pilus assembly protein Flp/PilA
MQFINDTILRLYCWMKDEKAQTMAEYGLILALISVVAVGVLGLLGGQNGNVFNSIKGSLGG